MRERVRVSFRATRAARLRPPGPAESPRRPDLRPEQAALYAWLLRRELARLPVQTAACVVLAAVTWIAAARSAPSLPGVYALPFLGVAGGQVRQALRQRDFVRRVHGEMADHGIDLPQGRPAQAGIVSHLVVSALVVAVGVAMVLALWA
jgi:hypothetical protein